MLLRAQNQALGLSGQAMRCSALQCQWKPQVTSVGCRCRVICSSRLVPIVCCLLHGAALVHVAAKDCSTVESAGVAVVCCCPVFGQPLVEVVLRWIVTQMVEKQEGVKMLRVPAPVARVQAHSCA
jgi:hypothetical protein